MNNTHMKKEGTTCHPISRRVCRWTSFKSGRRPNVCHCSGKKDDDPESQVGSDPPFLSNKFDVPRVWIRHCESGQCFRDCNDYVRAWFFLGSYGRIHQNLWCQRRLQAFTPVLQMVRTIVRKKSQGFIIRNFKYRNGKDTCWWCVYHLNNLPPIYFSPHSPTIL